MPEFDKPDFEVIEGGTENGGVVEETKRKEKLAGNHFDTFLVEFGGGKDLKTVCQEQNGQTLIDTYLDQWTQRIFSDYESHW